MSRSIIFRGIFFIIMYVVFQQIAFAQSESVKIARGKWQGQEVEYIVNELLLKLKPGTSTEQVAAALTRKNAVLETAFHSERRWGKILLPEGFDALEQLNSWENLPYFEYCTPNLVIRPYAVTNDPDFNLQWALHNTGQAPSAGTPSADIRALAAWDISTGNSSTRIAVLDSGMPLDEAGNFSHPDLDDPDKFIRGQDLLPSSPQNTPGIRDELGHGTHVLGILGAEVNNAIGVSGVAWNTRIIVHQILGTGWGSIETLANGIWASIEDGATVINISGGALLDNHSMVEAAVSDALDNNVVICAAAGNNGREWVGFPANLNVRYENVIAVAATNHHDERAPYSNYGGGYSGWQIDIGAPGGHSGSTNGEDIYSTLPGYPTVYSPNSESYGYTYGTSMATPFVTGAVALLQSIQPDLSPGEIKSILTTSSDEVSGQNWGRLNIYQALLQVTPTAINEPLNEPITDIENFQLLQNYPNPFNATTNIGFTVSEFGFTELKIYDVRGSLVKTLVNEPLNAGNHSVVWQGRDERGQQVASGLYFYHIRIGKQFEQVRRMMLVK